MEVVPARIAAQAAQEIVENDENVSSEDNEEPEVDPNDTDFKRGGQAKRDGLTKCLITAVREDAEHFRKWRAGYDSVEGVGA